MPDSATAAGEDSKGRILIVDDEPAIVESLQLLLEAARYHVVTANTANSCLDVITKQPCDLVLLDMMLPDRPGLAVLQDIRRVDRSLPVVMLTAYGSIETAVEATRLGATNFLTKPWNNSQLLLEIEQTLMRRKLEAENARLRSELRLSKPLDNLIGKCEVMQRVYVMIFQVARTSSTVLISGESGTGKELVAKAIHNSSPRADKPFVIVNSGSIPVELLESTLFGHVKGSFTGALRDRQGCFEIANEGTIFLDEVGTLSHETQTKLLRVIQEREFVPVGSNDLIRVDVRILAATNENLEAAVAQGRFREDLYYRLNVIDIKLPPLRERLDDVPLLIEEFLTQFCRREKDHFLDHRRHSTLRFTPEAQRILMNHSWPGNVRELRNVVERAVVLATRQELGPEVLPESLVKNQLLSVRVDSASIERSPGASLPQVMEDFERRVLLAELDKHGYNQTETAKALRVALSTLNQKIQRLGIDVKRRRSE